MARKKLNKTNPYNEAQLGRTTDLEKYLFEFLSKICSHEKECLTHFVKKVDWQKGKFLKINIFIIFRL